MTPQRKADFERMWRRRAVVDATKGWWPITILPVGYLFGLWAKSMGPSGAESVALVMGVGAIIVAAVYVATRHSRGPR